MMTLRDYVDIKLGKHTLRLLPEKAALWLEQDTLLVTDLHLGKAETFQALGLAVPSGHHDQDLECLHQLCQKVQPTSLAILGDLFHARVGLNEALVKSIAEAFEKLELDILWIAGNHDRQLHNLVDTLGVRLEHELLTDELLLTHKPTQEDVPNICGHLHPRARLWVQKEKIDLPCFVLEKNTLILPAFGSFTAGTQMKKNASRGLYACLGTKVLEL
jgi:uncharacterized protein